VTSITYRAEWYLTLMYLWTWIWNFLWIYDYFVVPPEWKNWNDV